MSRSHTHTPAQVSAGLFVSLDGVVDADGDWQYPWFDEELFGVIGGGVQADTVLMGRVSARGYESLRRDHPDSPMLAFLDGVERHVVSATLEGPTWSTWPGTRVVHPEALATTVDRMRREGRRVQVAGSPTVVRALLAQHLLDELMLLLLPIVVGGGPRLFPEASDGTGPRQLPLELVEHRALRSGVVVSRYRSIAAG